MKSSNEDIGGKYGDISGKYGDISGLGVEEARQVIIKGRLVNRIDYLESRLAQIERDILGLITTFDSKISELDARFSGLSNP